MSNRPDVYKEASALHRLQNGLLIGEFTVFLAASGMLLRILYSLVAPSVCQISVLAILGISISLCFFFICRRAYFYSEHARQCAAKLQLIMKSNENMEEEHHLYRLKKENGQEDKTDSKFTAWNAMRSMYFLSVVLWIILIVSHLIGR